MTAAEYREQVIAGWQVDSAFREAADRDELAEPSP